MKFIEKFFFEFVFYFSAVFNFYRFLTLYLLFGGVFIHFLFHCPRVVSRIGAFCSFFLREKWRGLDLCVS